MDTDKIITKLHMLERVVLPHLSEHKTFEEITKASGLKKIEVMRALQWLQNKELIEIKKTREDIVGLDKNGIEYLKQGLPEKRFLLALKHKQLPLEEIKAKAKLSKEELNISLGILKRKAAISIKKDNGLVIELTDSGKQLLDKESLEEKFLKNVENGKPISLLKPEESQAFTELKKRKQIIKVIETKAIVVELTDLGKEVIKKKGESKQVVDHLTTSILKTGSWKGKDFRGYDIKINVPRIYGGKHHFVNLAVEYARRIWIELGFEEMKGTMVQTSFWNFDALFTAQDHPVRELQDTFYLKEPEKGKLPNKEIVEKVKRAHENGGNTGSIGWQYKWDPEDAMKNVLRTHTTVLSARTISTLKKKDLPAKFFSVGKNFRNETSDWSHLIELIQVEGIVVDPNANFKHLKGYLIEFFKKMGYPKARVRPGYFPYTEPSAEVDVFHPTKKKWIELGGSGIFRPEVVKPLLGEDIPVLAWGLGLERSILEYYKINDIRDLYKNDIKKLREIKTWLL